jgi:tyrosyl-tRNA synthetase
VKPEKQLEIIKRGAVEVIPEEELLAKIEKARKEKRGLRIKFGADPSAPDIHLGHTVCLRKLKEFQDLGHEIIFLIGDFTAAIGDPSGQIETRKPLSREKIIENAETYQKQVFKVLNPSQTKVVYNSQWCNKLTLTEVLGLASKYTVARMIERDDFQKRYRSGQEIGIHEFLYPLIQAYDSIILNSDVEVGGTDQKFNLLLARELQHRYGQEPQVVLTMPILLGTDGSRKMSKSLGNYIGITEPPREIFGKIMSISDELMFTYYELLTSISPAELEEMKKGSFHPRYLKKSLAKEIVALYYGNELSLAAEKEFENIFKQGGTPEEIPSLIISKSELKDGKIGLVEILLLSAMAKSKSEARRLIKAGAVKIDNKKCDNSEFEVKVKKGMIIKTGKRKFAEIDISD